MQVKDVLKRFGKSFRAVHLYNENRDTYLPCQIIVHYKHIITRNSIAGLLLIIYLEMDPLHERSELQ